MLSEEVHFRKSNRLPSNFHEQSSSAACTAPPPRASSGLEPAPHIRPIRLHGRRCVSRSFRRRPVPPQGTRPESIHPVHVEILQKKVTNQPRIGVTVNSYWICYMLVLQLRYEFARSKNPDRLISLTYMDRWRRRTEESSDRLAAGERCKHRGFGLSDYISKGTRTN